MRIHYLEHSNAALKVQKATIDIPTSIDVFHYENGEYLFPYIFHCLERRKLRRKVGSESVRVRYWAIVVFAHT